MPTETGDKWKTEAHAALSPPLWDSHILNTDVDPSTTWGFYQACKDFIHSNLSNLMK